jgi:DNA-binding transcriptional ArsR family regulator
MGYLSDNPDVNTVNEMIEVIEKSDECTMLAYVVERMFYENTNKRINEVYNWNTVKNSIDGLLGIIKEIEFFNDEMKQNLIESIENAEETKKRYCMLLRQFYEKVYRPVEEDTFKLISSAMEQYEKEFALNPQKFSRKYFAKDISVFSNAVNIHISYFRCAGSDYWSSREGLEWIILGSETSRLFEDEPEKERVLNFLKAISDKKRMIIIELLAEKPWYVNEIAEKIGMSAATTSYHLTSLQELGIVDFERYDHRFYYYLNKDKLKELFNEAMKVYLHE